MEHSDVLSEGSLHLITVATWGFPFAGYVFGIILRHYAFRDQGQPSLLQRFAVGLPAALILVSSFNALLREIGDPSWTSIIFVTGFIMEQGILLDLGLTYYLESKRKSDDHQNGHHSDR